MLDESPFGMILIDCARLLRARFDRALDDARLGLTAGEARALVYVCRHPGSRQSVLATHMWVEPMTLVGFLDRLEARGLVVREPDPADRRAKIVQPTPQAEPLALQVLEAFRTERESAMADLSAEEIVLLKDMLGRLRNRMIADDRGGAGR
ncbi:MarR family winged helix-turn-helix transcriptional regulator [Azospirillum sp. Marseille-Q6669]